MKNYYQVMLGRKSAYSPDYWGQFRSLLISQKRL
jgi:hypothetical protein